MEQLVRKSRGLNVFLVEDSAELCVRLRKLLEENIADLSIVGEAATPSAAIKGIGEKQPHVVILDLALEGGSGFEVLKEVHPRLPHVVFAVLSNNNSSQYKKRAFTLGASHYFDKSLEQSELVRLLKEMAERISS